MRDFSQGWHKNFVEDLGGMIMDEVWLVYLIVQIINHSQLTTHHSPLTTHHSPLTTHHSPLTTHHYFIINDCVLPVNRPTEMARKTEGSRRL
jgi:hypothetical protein